jgi:hypothetical protein
VAAATAATRSRRSDKAVVRQRRDARTRGSAAGTSVPSAPRSIGARPRRAPHSARQSRTRSQSARTPRSSPALCGPSRHGGVAAVNQRSCIRRAAAASASDVPDRAVARPVLRRRPRCAVGGMGGESTGAIAAPHGEPRQTYAPSHPAALAILAQPPALRHLVPRGVNVGSRGSTAQRETGQRLRRPPRSTAYQFDAKGATERRGCEPLLSPPRLPTHRTHSPRRGWQRRDGTTHRVKTMLRLLGLVSCTAERGRVSDGAATTPTTRTTPTRLGTATGASFGTVNS